MNRPLIVTSMDYGISLLGLAPAQSDGLDVKSAGTAAQLLVGQRSASTVKTHLKPARKARWRKLLSVPLSKGNV